PWQGGRGGRGDGRGGAEACRPLQRRGDRPRVRGCIRPCQGSPAQVRRAQPPIDTDEPAPGVRRSAQNLFSDQETMPQLTATKPTDEVDLEIPPPETIRLQATSGFGRVLAPRE